MSAKDLIRQQLEELMGAEALGTGTSVKDVEDERNCRFYLAGMCPHELFSNTKMDMGSCGKQHIPEMQEEYAKRLKEGKPLGYERELLAELDKIIEEVERKIRSQQTRLEREQQYDVETAAKAKVVEDMGEQVGKTLAEAQRLADEGKEEESKKLMEQVRELKLKHEQLQSDFKALLPGGKHTQQKLRVCEICGSYLSIFDNDRRLADHFGGKLHLGYLKAREYAKKLQDVVKSTPAPAPRDRRSSRDDRDDRRRRRSRSRSRERDRDRGRRSRSRSRDSGRRDRYYDRRDRSRDRSRDRDRYDRRRSDYDRRGSRSSRRRDYDDDYDDYRRRR